MVSESTLVQEYVPETWLESGDQVIVQGREVVQVKATGKTYRSPWIAIFTWEQGKIRAVREFFDTATMAHALSKEGRIGLS